MAYGDLNEDTDAAAELGRNPVMKYQIQPGYGDEQADAGPNPSRETIFSGANGDRGILFLPVQLTTSNIGNLTQFIFTLVICDDHVCFMLIPFILDVRHVDAPAGVA